MIEIIKDVSLLILGGAVTTVIFYIRRNIEEKPVFEKIDKTDKLLSLRKKIDDSEYTIDDLKHLESVLMGRAITAKSLSDSFIDEAEVIKKFEEINKKGGHLTQRELNIGADEAYKRTESKLNDVIAALQEYFSPEEIDNFKKLNKLWKLYQKKNAEFVASRYEGGSIKPLIYSSTIEATTVARLVELKAELESLKDTTVKYEES